MVLCLISASLSGMLKWQTPRQIGRSGLILWPTCRPDLNPLDFFMWGHVKSIVYAEIIQSKPLKGKD
jgi:hypothetical protein